LVIGLAIADSEASVAYLARPCQFLNLGELANCDPGLWTGARFREDAVIAVGAAIDVLKRNSGAQEIALVGYSGGGAMAALVASRRGDISCLVTIAAPLDTDAWTDAIGVSRLGASLNPADAVSRLLKVRQTHFRGATDKVVPPRSIGRFLAGSPGATMVDRADFDHECCWLRDWTVLRSQSCLSD
jgi:pimeloyl-ACP methyl ester carboxylesterase